VSQPISLGARYLVTGGAGFIGSRLTKQLLAAGESVRVLDDLSSGSWDNLDPWLDDHRLVCVHGDIRHAQTVAKAAAGVEVIFHLAADCSVPRSIAEPALVSSVNVGGTVTVLEVARQTRARRVIFAASCAAYGNLETLPLHEAMRPQPLSPYAASKLACEQYARAFHQVHGLETLSLRYFNIFGPGQCPEGPYAAAIPRFGTAALLGKPIVIYGDGEQTRDFCYVDNIVRANLLAAGSRHALGGEVINIGTGRRVSVNQIARAISETVQQPIEIRREPPRAGDVRHSWANIERAQSLLDYAPSVSWEEGLAPTVAYLRERVAAERSLGVVGRS